MPHHRPTSHAPADGVVARARWVLMGLFTLAGVMVSSWLARLPAVRDALDLSTGELGGVLLVGALGALVAVTVAGAVTARWGGRVSLVLSAAGFSLGYLLLGLGAASGSVAVLGAGVFLNGVSFAVGSVPLNVESSGVERRLGRTVLPQFHAAFSIGAVLGSLLGAAMAHLDVSLLAQFAATAVVALVWRLASIPHVVLDTAARREQPAGAPARGAREAAPRVARSGALLASLGAWRERRTVLIGLVIMSAALSEGAASDWLALAVVDGFARTEAVGAAFFGVFVAAMTLVRVVGTRLIDRHGRVAVLRVSGLVSLGGLLVFGFAPNLVLAGIGVVAWGLGAALAVPIGIAAASDEPLRAAGRVSVVSAFASLAHLAAPPLLGLAAEGIGARHALLLITGAMVVSVLLAGHVARPDVATTPAGALTGPAADHHAGGAATEPAAALAADRPDAPTAAVLTVSSPGGGTARTGDTGAVPTPPTRPGPEVRLRRLQRRVRHLPAGHRDLWPSGHGGRRGRRPPGLVPSQPADRPRSRRPAASRPETPEVTP